MGLIRFMQKALKRDKNALIVHKTDDELTRYVKQKHIMAERQRYNKALKQEEERRRLGLNVSEKQILYHEQVKSYETKVYPKSELNDLHLNLDYLADKELYNPLGRRKWFFHPQRLFFVKPLYTTTAQYSPTTPLHHYLLRFVGCLLFLKLGYKLGLLEAEVFNEKLNNSKLVEFESEDQIFDYLFNKEKDAVFLSFYVPG